MRPAAAADEAAAAAEAICNPAAWCREETAIVWPRLRHPSLCAGPVRGGMQQRINTRNTIITTVIIIIIKKQKTTLPYLDICSNSLTLWRGKKRQTIRLYFYFPPPPKPIQDNLCQKHHYHTQTERAWKLCAPREKRRTSRQAPDSISRRTTITHQPLHFPRK